MAGYVHINAVREERERLRRERARLRQEADLLRRRRLAVARPYQPAPAVDYSPGACATRLEAATAEAMWHDPKRETRRNAA